MHHQGGNVMSAAAHILLLVSFLALLPRPLISPTLVPCRLSALVCLLPHRPLFSSIPAIATGPVLCLIGAVIFMSSIFDINWHDATDAVPAFTTIMAMPFTNNIAYGETQWGPRHQHGHSPYGSEPCWCCAAIPQDKALQSQQYLPPPIRTHPPSPQSLLP